MFIHQMTGEHFAVSSPRGSASGGVRVHVAEPVRGVPLLPSVPRQGAAHDGRALRGHHRAGTSHVSAA